MAIEVALGGNGGLFVGEDKTINVEVLDAAEVPVNIAAFTIALDIRTSDASATALITKTPATITGTYSATRSANTQRASFTLTDTETAVLTARSYRYSVKRTDDGSETVICYGQCLVERATQA